MRAGRPAAGGGRWVRVEPERLERWLEGFAARHGAPLRWSLVAPDVVSITAGDGALADCTVPFPPLHVDDLVAYGGLVSHALRERCVGVLLVRLGGYATGVFDGARLRVSKVGSRPVHGRAAAGGWSQQRFARRRDNQAQAALQAAADVAVRVLLPSLTSLDRLVTGGDRHAVDAVLGDVRLAPLLALRTPTHLDVATPNQQILLSTPALFRAVSIRVRDARLAP